MTAAPIGTADWVRLWQDRLGLSDSEAARALRLGNPHKVMHEFKTGRRPVSDTTLAHMELLEALSITAGMMAHGKISATRVILEKTLLARVPMAKFGSGDAIEVLPSTVESTVHSTT